jgi:hypothetical protein
MLALLCALAQLPWAIGWWMLPMNLIPDREIGLMIGTFAYAFSALPSAVAAVLAAHAMFWADARRPQRLLALVAFVIAGLFLWLHLFMWWDSVVRSHHSHAWPYL